MVHVGFICTEFYMNYAQKTLFSSWIFVQKMVKTGETARENTLANLVS